MKKRKGEVTFKGNPLTLIGPRLKAGDKAPKFRLLNGKLETVTEDILKGKTTLISVVPSLDTPVCADQTRRFNQELAKLGGSVQILTVSADLPFAQARFCGAENIKIQTLSDHKDMNFGDAWGTHIEELRLETRAIFVVASGGTLKHVEYVPEVTHHPNYDAALAALKG